MSTNTTREASSNKSSKFEAGAAGAGGGTLLVLLANNLPDGYFLKSWLVLVAPSISIATSTFWIWLKSQVERYLRKREFKNTIIQAKRTLQEALENPNTSDDHKKGLRKDLEQLENQAVRISLNKVRALIENE